MKDKILKILRDYMGPELAYLKANEIVELFNGHKCPKCGEELRFGLSDEMKELIKNSRLFKK